MDLILDTCHKIPCDGVINIRGCAKFHHKALSYFDLLLASSDTYQIWSSVMVIISAEMTDPITYLIIFHSLQALCLLGA